MSETVDLCWMQTLNGSTLILKPDIPVADALGVLAEEQQAQIRENRYGFGSALFLRSSDDLFAAVQQAMRSACRDVTTVYDSYYRSMIALEDVWRLVRDHPDQAPRAELRQALIHTAAQCLCAIEGLDL